MWGPFPLPLPLPWPPALAARDASVLIHINELLFCIRTIVTPTTYNLTLLNSTANLTLQKVAQNRPFTIYYRLTSILEGHNLLLWFSVCLGRYNDAIRTRIFIR